MTSENAAATDTLTMPPVGGGRRGRHRPSAPPGRPWAARPRLLGGLAVGVAAVAAGVALLVPSAAQLDRPPSGSTWHAATGSPSPTPSVPRGRTAVDVEFAGTLSWALLDGSGRIAGSQDLATPVPAESMVKVWIVADYLRRTAENGTKPSATRLSQASRAIRDGDTAAARLLNATSGGGEQISRMIAICRLTDSRVDPTSWTRTRISARDAAQLGRCIADGRAAGPSWTAWVRTEMTKVRGGTAKGGSPRGMRWGIVDGLPEQVTAQGVGFANGWSSSSGQLRVNCLAVADSWSLAVLTRYAAQRGLTYGAEACAEVATQLIPTAGTAM
ncbi:MAG TPA: hypothetical protein VF462_08165 [Micromonosporaceae bacterium]